jgi:leucyl/phenylalanyl-tRNA--protein transferase
MPVFLLDRRPIFPPAVLAEPEGLLAVGGDLSTERLLVAYKHGIFPWYDRPGGPILWWSPDPRLVLFPAELHVSRRLRRTIRQGRFEVRFDSAFEAVIRACAEADRPGEPGTWITPEMQQAYARLHRLGFARCAECWREGQLVGGIYGVQLGRAFFGESMFHAETDASKVALVSLVEKLASEGVELIDSQVTSAHMLRFGAREIPRDEFLARVARAVVQ